MNKSRYVTILWCITGGEYLLAESVAALEGANAHTVVFSQAGEEVASMYGLRGRIEKAALEVVSEKTHGRSSPITMRLHSYDLVVVAPCTANTVAKVVNGVADSLVSNIVSQALKMGIEVIALPTDYEEEVTGKTVSGKDVKIRCRPVDLENVEKLKKEVKVVSSAKELRELL